MCLIASGLTTERSDRVIAYLERYVSVEPVSLIVVGKPLKLDNTLSSNGLGVESFVRRLRAALPAIPVEYYDERFTTLLAHRAMLDGGLKRHRRRDRELVDKISAVIILQDYLEYKRYKNL
jgi:putative Holliday junction resolvase